MSQKELTRIISGGILKVVVKRRFGGWFFVPVA